MLVLFYVQCRTILGTLAKLRKASTSFVMPVHVSVYLSVCLTVRPSFCLSVRLSAWNNSAPTERIVMCVFFKNCFVNIRQD
jgi:hypothetical protein